MKNLVEVRFTLEQLEEVKICIKNALIDVESDIRHNDFRLKVVKARREKATSIPDIEQFKIDQHFYEQELEKSQGTQIKLSAALKELEEI